MVFSSWYVPLPCAGGPDSLLSPYSVAVGGLQNDLPGRCLSLYEQFQFLIHQFLVPREFWRSEKPPPFLH